MSSGDSGSPVGSVCAWGELAPESAVMSGAMGEKEESRQRTGGLVDGRGKSLRRLRQNPECSA